MSLNPDLEPLAGLIGVWRGEGRGEYPTIESFQFTEELTFSDVGKPFLHYMQRTWSPTGAPMHMETGFLRLVAGTNVELVLAQPTGQTELAEGSLITAPGGFKCTLDSRIINSASAKTVDTTRRTLELSGDKLVTRFAMAAVGVPLTHHLESKFVRQPAAS